MEIIFHPCTLTQLKVLLYRSSRSWSIFSGIPLDRISNHKDCLSTESKADRKSTYATQDGFLYSRLVCRIINDYITLHYITLHYINKYLKCPKSNRDH